MITLPPAIRSALRPTWRRLKTIFARGKQTVRHWTGEEPRISELKGVNPDDVTLLIPSRGRAEALEALLSYLECKGVKFKILILESGNTYSELIRKFGKLDIELVNYPEQTSLASKLHDAAARVKTPLVCPCTDDDITLVDAIIKCAAFLKGNPAYSVCQGYHGRFLRTMSRFELLDILWFTPSIEDDNPVLRLNTLIRRYQPVCWAVFRSEVFLDAAKTFSVAPNGLFSELLWSATAVIRGKVKRLPLIYCLRAVEDTNLKGHPFYLFLESPAKFFSDYDIYKKQLLAIFEKSLPPGQMDNAGRKIDLIHANLFCREIDGGILSYFTDEVLKRGDRSILDPDVQAAIKPAQPNAVAQPGTLISTPTKQYFVLDKFMRPEPREEILLDSTFPDSVISELEGYTIS